MISPSRESKSEDLLLFLDRLSQSLPNYSDEITSIKPIRSDSLTPNESYFIFNINSNEIEYHEGMDVILECSKESISLKRILSMIHPNDREEIEIIIRESMMQIVNLKIPVKTNYLNFSFRMKTKEGDYVHVISQNTVHSLDSSGKARSIFVKFQKVRFLERPMVLKWWVDPLYIDCSRIEEMLKSVNMSFFTNREQEIIPLLLKELSSSQIAKELNLSQHTIVTHRKNIYRKSNCHSLEELKLFCSKNRLI